MIKAVIVDCFGVVINDALELVLQKVRAEDPGKARQMIDIITASNRGMIEVAESRAQLAELLGVSDNEYYEQVVSGSVKDQELLQYIRSLRDHYKTAMLSNVGKGSLQQRFTQEELANSFDLVVASGDIGFAKPESQAYEIVAERLGLRCDECLFTDDREEYCQGARATGMRAIRYQSFAQFKRDLDPLLVSEH